jgi:hypothetical protein
MKKFIASLFVLLLAFAADAGIGTRRGTPSGSGWTILIDTTVSTGTHFIGDSFPTMLIQVEAGTNATGEIWACDSKSETNPSVGKCESLLAFSGSDIDSTVVQSAKPYLHVELITSETGTGTTLHVYGTYEQVKAGTGGSGGGVLGEGPLAEMNLATPVHGDLWLLDDSDGVLDDCLTGGGTGDLLCMYTDDNAWSPVAGGSGASLSLGTRTGTTMEVRSNTGSNVTLLEADASQAGLIDANDWNTIQGIEAGAAADQNATEVLFDDLSATPALDGAPSNVETALESILSVAEIAWARLKYDAVVDIRDPATACQNWATAVEPWTDNSLTRDWTVAVVGNPSGPIIIETHGYDDSGAWPYKSCFMLHPLVSTSSDSPWPDSLTFPNTIINRNAAANHSIIIDMLTDYIPVSQAGMTKNACLFDIGNTFLAGLNGSGGNWGSIGGTVTIRGNTNVDVTTNNPVSVDAAQQKKIPEGRGSARIDSEEVSAFSPFCFHGATYGDFGDWIVDWDIDSNDVGILASDSWGWTPPTPNVQNGGEGIGMQFFGSNNGTMNMRNLKQMDYGAVWGGGDLPQAGDPSGNLEDDYVHIYSSCSTGNCDPVHRAADGPDIVGGVIEGHDQSLLVFLDQKFTSVETYMECGLTHCASDAISFRPELCNGSTGTNAVPEGTPVPSGQTALAYCADGNGAANIPEDPGDWALSVFGGRQPESRVANQANLWIGPGARNDFSIIWREGSRLNRSQVDDELFAYSSTLACPDCAMIVYDSSDRFPDPAGAGSPAGAPHSDYEGFVSFHHFGVNLGNTNLELPQDTNCNQAPYTNAGHVCIDTDDGHLWIQGTDINTIVASSELNAILDPTADSTINMTDQKIAFNYNNEPAAQDGLFRILSTFDFTVPHTLFEVNTLQTDLGETAAIAKFSNGSNAITIDGNADMSFTLGAQIDLPDDTVVLDDLGACTGPPDKMVVYDDAGVPTCQDVTAATSFWSWGTGDANVASLPGSEDGIIINDDGDGVCETGEICLGTTGASGKVTAESVEVRAGADGTNYSYFYGNTATEPTGVAVNKPFMFALDDGAKLDEPWWRASDDASAHRMLTSEGMTNCNGASDKVIYNGTTHEFDCGVDAGAGSVNAWTTLSSTGETSLTAGTTDTLDFLEGTGININFTTPGGVDTIEIVNTVTDTNTNAGTICTNDSSFFLAGDTNCYDLDTVYQDTDADLDELALLSAVAGDIIVGNATPDWSKLTVGTNGQVLTVTAGIPSWEDATGGGNMNTSTYDNDTNGVVDGAEATTISAVSTAGVLAAGDAVYIIDWNITYGCVNVGLADADDPTEMPAVGILTTATAVDNCNGVVTTSGDVTNLELGALTVGEGFYVSVNGTAGNTITTSRPTGTTTAIQKMGVATRNTGAGDNFVVIGAGRSNDVPNLNDANIWIGDSNNEAAKFPITGEITMTNGGVATIDNNEVPLDRLSDVAIVTPAGGHFLVHDGVGDFDNVAMSGDATLAAGGALDVRVGNESQDGLLQLATITELNTATLDSKAISPLNMESWNGGSSVATVGTITTGTWQGSEIGDTWISNSLTITGLSGTNSGDELSATELVEGILEVATTGEVNGSLDTKIITPLKLDDFNGNANIATVGTITTGSIALTTGTITGAVDVDVDTGDTVNTPLQQGEYHIADNATATNNTTYNLQTADVGESICVYDNGGGSGRVIVNPDTADTILLDGTALSAGDSIISSATGDNGDFVCLLAIDGTTWITLGRSGTWTDNN